MYVSDGNILAECNELLYSTSSKTFTSPYLVFASWHGLYVASNFHLERTFNILRSKCSMW